MSDYAPPIALTIAGSDSSGGAGIQADLKSFCALGVYGASVITALTAQNTRGVSAIHLSPPLFVKQQLEAVFADLDIRAVKIGMAGSAETIFTIADILRRYREVPVVLDPVMVATTGAALLDESAEYALCHALMPLCDIVTPNSCEAARLLNEDETRVELEREAQARRLRAFGPQSVLITGGGADGPEAVDLYDDGVSCRRLTSEHIATKNTHGTGCTLSAAMAAFLACGQSTFEALQNAKAYVTGALQHADELNVGEGAGPVHHFYRLWGRGE